MDDALFKRLESYVRQARVILFTGAGFSMGAASRAGEPIPSTRSLTEEMWAVAFPGEPYDGSDLQDVYEAALAQARGRAADLLRARLSVDPGSLPEYYTRWFSMPWHRVYTINIDDLADACDRAFDLPRPIESISALTAAFSGSDDRLQVVHLNGQLEDVPDVTFSGRQYAERLSAPDAWYANLARELVSHPFVFIGTTLDEPPLWQYVESRGARDPGGRELRPGSLLVSPSLARPRAVALRRYQVDLVEGTVESFEDEVLRHLTDAAEVGLKVVNRRPRGKEEALHDVETLLDDSSGDEREFLLGREPKWSDITDGFAVERAFDLELRAQVEDEQPRLVVVTGTAGSGKSSSAKRLVLGLRAEGKSVVQLNMDADLRSYRIRRAIEASSADVLLIEDLDRLGRSAAAVLEDVQEARPDLLVIAALRSAPYDALGISAHVRARSDAFEAVTPLLADEDIDSLLDALDRANRLGSLKGKPREAQRDVMASKCGRQLLVAMIEATSGQRFEAKVEGECRELSPESALVYGVVAVAMNFRIRLQDADVLAAVGGDPSTRLRVIDDLVRTHLLVRDKGGIELRHRVIAERTVDFFREARLIETPLKGLAFALAMSARPGQLRDTPQGRAVIRLINHRLLIGFVTLAGGDGPDVIGIRGVYEELEPLLTHDHHFWLQRGSLETERGDLDLAKNFLEQARSLAPDDPWVRTQWAYMTLKRASRNPTDPNAPDQVESAFGELDEVIAANGRKDSYPFHVYGSQGLAWANRGRLTPDDKERLLLSLRRVVDEGIALHRANRELHQLAKDLENAYLKLATA